MMILFFLSVVWSNSDMAIPGTRTHLGLRALGRRQHGRSPHPPKALLRASPAPHRAVQLQGTPAGIYTHSDVYVYVYIYIPSRKAPHLEVHHLIRSVSSIRTMHRGDSVIARPGNMPGHRQGMQTHQEFVISEEFQAYPEYVLRYQP